MTKDLEERFWAKVDWNGPMEPNMATLCWVWTAAHSGGYGSFGLPGRPQVGAHRVSWMLCVGQIPEGACVLHKCDNRSCVRPDHLFLGTKGDNIRDAKRKGRNARGEKHGSAKLTRVSVREIRRRRVGGESGKQLAKEFCVSDTMIYKIANRQAWVHVE